MTEFFFLFSRSATPVVESKSTRDILAKVSAGPDQSTAELRKQVEKELRIVKDRYVDLEKENARLVAENKRLKQSSSPYDDLTSTSSRIENSPRIRRLEMENDDLRDEVSSLKAKIARTADTSSSWDFRSKYDYLTPGGGSSLSSKFSSSLRGSEDESRSLRFKIFDLEDKVTSLTEELEKRKLDVDPEVLKNRVSELETEMSKWPCVRMYV